MKISKLIKKNIIACLLDEFAIFSIRSIFESDDSKIISKEGRNILSNESEMKKINEKILHPGDKNEYNEIFI